MTFVECYLEGSVQSRDINWWVEAWQAGLSGEGQKLHEYLGLTWEEYALWSRKPSALPRILKARSGNLSA